MHIKKNISLKDYNTFGINVYCNEYTELNTINDIIEFCDYLKNNPKKFLLLGGGSNILFTNNFEGICAHVNLKGISFETRPNGNSYAKAYAGETWHEFVQITLSKGLGGLENLSLIPGKVGAAPMQNIGAYGVEIKDHFHSLEAIEIASGNIHTFSNKDCQFGYRESIFKKELKGKYIIISVTFELSSNMPTKMSYGAITDVLNSKQIVNPTYLQISEAVISIRQSKLPNPSELGNAGSFFKNPEISLTHYNSLKEKYPDLHSYPLSDTTVKVPAGWLIEKAGWKGKIVGNTGAHRSQALVLVNYGQANGNEIVALSKAIQDSVFELFEIHLETEVNII